MKRIFLALSLVLPLPVVRPVFAQVAPSPVRTPTPAPTATAAPDPAPGPTATPAPGATPVPGATPNPQNPVAPTGDTPGTGKKGPAAPAGTPVPTPDPDAPPKPRTIEQITRTYEKVDGLFTLYRRTSNNKQQLLAEIKESQIGPFFLLQTTFATGNAGTAVAGRPADDTVWKWVKTPDNRLAVVVPNLWYRSTDPNLKIAVERDFPDGYLKVTPILATSTEKKTVLIDISGLFDGSIPGLNTAFQGGQLAALTGQASYALDPELSFIERLRNFPTNIVVESLFHYRRAGNTGGSQTQADTRSLPIRVAFNLYNLPSNNGYKSRKADPRIGYFINGQLSANRSGYENFDDEATTDPVVHYINRWNLVKADPSAKLSKPVKPIVFILDDTIPVRYRPAVREAILSWNPVFERVGIVGAVQVKDAPKEVAGVDQDYDHADMRFNTIRWVASPPTEGGAYAVAQMRENPVTGEIINASITVNANWTRIGYREKNQVINPLAAQQLEQGLMGDACELGGEMMDNAARSLDIAQNVDPRFSDEKYVNALLKGVVMHEFGHILGLRHNFLGSMYHTPAELASPTKSNVDNISASIMDYVGFNIYGLRTGAPLFARGPGKYDYWAISYGYTANDKDLKAIANRNGEPGLLYYGDELADSFDPTNVRYDLSSDPLAYAEKSFGVTRYLLTTLNKREPKNGQTYAYFTRRLNGLLSALTTDASNTQRYIGGYKVRRVVKGEKAKIEPFTPVPLAQQQRALDMMKRFIFDANSWKVPQEYLTKTSPDLLSISDSSARSAYPIRDQIAGLRTRLLVGLFASDRLTRLANGAYKFPGKTLPLMSLFQSARNGVWGQVGPATVYSDLQRDLAANHLQILIAMATDQVASAPMDAELLAQGDLKTLRTGLLQTAKSSPDTMTRLFAQDSVRRIDVAFKPKGDTSSSSQ